jgi:chaperone required for assembly of F1-ATPase
MSGGWVAKRFWKVATAEAVGTAFTVRLDGRAVKTPAKTLLEVPTLALAQAIAVEWDAQQGVIKPDSMPFTRMANSALDKVAPQFAEVAGLIAAYGASDLICYRANGPEKLLARQAAAWDPLLAWSASALDAPLVTTAGVMHVEQPHASIARLEAAVRACTPYQLAALHDLVMISGSLVGGLAVSRGRIDAQALWDISRVDERWQAELWGEDEEAAQSEGLRHAALIHAGRFYGLCG